MTAGDTVWNWLNFNSSNSKSNDSIESNELLNYLTAGCRLPKSNWQLDFFINKTHFNYNYEESSNSLTRSSGEIVFSLEFAS